MKTFTVYEPPNAAADRLDRAESLVFVQEGYSWVAAIFTPVWLLANRFWLAFLAYLAAIILIKTGTWLIGAGQAGLNAGLMALHLIIGLEADSIKRWSLEWKGWQLAGTVNGRNAEDCERRFFDNWLPRQPLIRPETLSGSGTMGANEASPLSGPERKNELQNELKGDHLPEPRATGGWHSSRIFGGPKRA